MGIYFTVGEMAKFSGISRQTLIHYDREDVFKPKVINGENGYRYYTPDQFEVLESILVLKEIGLSLKEIRDHMKGRTESTTLEVLKAQRVAVEKKIEKLKTVEKRLSRKIEIIEEFTADRKAPEEIIHCQKEYLAIKKVDSPRNLLAVDIALKKLFKQASSKNYDHFYQTGDIVSEESLKKGLYRKFDHVFLSLGKPCEEKNLHIKPEGYYARAYHLGSYEEMETTYLSLLKRMAALGYRIAGPSYEYYIFDNLTTDSPHAYITEIQIRVENPVVQCVF